jgi:hypothetical protein
VTSQLEIPKANLDDWLATLKPYQSETLKSFLKTLSPEAAAQKWLGTTGSPEMAQFGGRPDSQPFWEAFKAEFTRFLCDETAYKAEKEKLAGLLKASPGSKSVIISMISTALGAKIGITAVLIVPVCAVLLWTVGQMGRKAYCANQASEPEKKEPAQKKPD